VTIAIGLLCTDGVVLAADREISVNKRYKTGSQKCRVIKRVNCQVGIVGAGSQDSIVLAWQELERKLTDRMTLDTVRETIDEVVDDVYRRLAGVEAQHEHSLELLIGAKTSAGVRLLKVTDWLPAIEVETYDALGFGDELGLYLLEQLYGTRDDLMVERGIVVACQVLKEVKKTVQGCGGPSDVIHLRRRFHAGLISEERIAECEHMSDRFFEVMRPVMLALTDIEVQNSALDSLLSQTVDRLRQIRTQDFLDRQRREFKDLFVAVEPEQVTATGYRPTVIVESTKPGTKN
jgi:20S proteasome alpha/beta subunit